MYIAILFIHFANSRILFLLIFLIKPPDLLKCLLSSAKIFMYLK